MDTVDTVKKGNPADFHVVAVPYPGRGHVNPMMNLCALLASRGIAITVVVTEEWLENITASAAGGAIGPAHLIRLRSIPNVVPLERNRGADFAGFVEAVNTKMEGPFERLLDDDLQLETPPCTIVADAQMPWVVDVGIRRNIPVASLWTMASSVFSLLYHFDLFFSNRHFPLHQNYFSAGREGERVEYIPGITSIRLADLYSIFRLDGLRSCASGPTILERAINTVRAATKAQYLLSATCYELYTLATDTLSANLPLPVYSVGPCIPYMKVSSTPGDAAEHYCLCWLNNQPAKSVLYVSLGSFLSTSGSQMEELAKGLRASKVRCLWVGRGEVQRLQEHLMTSGEKEMMTSLVVPWCEDQFKVLSHSSVGGFLTHCGWNSTMEAVFCGVPMLTFPLFWDQYPNSKLIVEDWGVGMRLKRKLVGENYFVVGRDQIAELVQRFMALDGEESKEMRRRSSELQKICKRAVEKGGFTHHNLDAFVEQIKRCSPFNSQLS